MILIELYEDGFDKPPYEVFLGFGHRIRFDSKREGKAFLAKLKRFFESMVIDLGSLQAELYTISRQMYLYLPPHDRHLYNVGFSECNRYMIRLTSRNRPDIAMDNARVVLNYLQEGNRLLKAVADRKNYIPLKGQLDKQYFEITRYLSRLTTIEAAREEKQFKSSLTIEFVRSA